MIKQFYLSMFLVLASNGERCIAERKAACPAAIFFCFMFLPFKSSNGSLWLVSLWEIICTQAVNLDQ